jgi:hypothetical protein
VREEAEVVEDDREVREALGQRGQVRQLVRREVGPEHEAVAGDPLQRVVDAVERHRAHAVERKALAPPGKVAQPDGDRGEARLEHRGDVLVVLVE